MDLEHEWCLRRVAGNERECGVVGDEVIDDDLGDPAAAASAEDVTIPPWRYGDTETAGVHRIDVPSRNRKQPDIDGEVIDADERRQIGAFGNPQSQACPADARPGDERHADVLKVGVEVEVLGQAADDDALDVGRAGENTSKEQWSRPPCPEWAWRSTRTGVVGASR